MFAGVISVRALSRIGARWRPRASGPDPFRFRIAQFRSARLPLRSGLAESHGADGHSGPLAGSCAPAEVFPLDERLTDRWGSLASFREAAGESTLVRLPSTTARTIQLLRLRPDFAGRTTRINPGVRSSVCSPRGGAAKEGFSDPHRMSEGQLEGHIPLKGDVWAEMVCTTVHVLAQGKVGQKSGYGAKSARICRRGGNS